MASENANAEREENNRASDSNILSEFAKEDGTLLS